MAVATASHLGTSVTFTVTSSISRSGSTVTVKLSYTLKTNYPGAYYANGWIRDDNVSSPSWVKVIEKTDVTQGGFTVSGSKTYTYTQNGSKTYSYTIQAGCQGAKSYSVQYGSTNTVTASISARTYTISYNKGANGTGTNTSDTKTHGTALTLKGAIFTRQGYTQTGWSTTDGGAKAYNLSASYTANAAITLYPYWEQSGFNIYQAVNGTIKQITAIYSVKNGVVSQVNGVYKVENGVVIQI